MYEFVIKEGDKDKTVHTLYDNKSMLCGIPVGNANHIRQTNTLLARTPSKNGAIRQIAEMKTDYSYKICSSCVKVLYD